MQNINLHHNLLHSSAMMAFFSKPLLVTLLIFMADIAAATPVDDKTDWKYTVGWDGTILDSAAIGEQVGPSVNTTSLKVCSYHHPSYLQHNNSHLSQIQKRAVGGVYICEDINWGGKCGYAVQPLDTCIKLGGDWNRKISSFGPDPCTYCIGESPCIVPFRKYY